MGHITPWHAAFAGALIVLGGSVGYLATVVMQLGDEAEALPPGGSGDEAASPSPSGSARGNVAYAGPAPARFLDAGLGLVPASTDPDIQFGGETGSAIAIDYLVPVASWWTGVDALTSDQLRALMDGSLTDWSAVGGQPGPVSFFALDSPAAAAAVSTFAPGARPSQRFASTADLLGAMTPGAGALALLPLSALTVDVSAVALDGVDLARGRGDLSSWPLVERIQVTALTERGKTTLAAMQALPLSPPAVTSLIVTGDYLPVRCSLARIEALGDWSAPFATTLGDLVRSADLALSSQDGSIQDLYEPYRCVQTVNLTSPAAAVEGLLALGIDGVTVATNHIFDCGQEGYCASAGFERTLELLHAAGIQTSGGGMNLDEALAPAIFDLGGVKLGLLSFDDIAAGNPSFLAATATSPGTAPMDDSYDDELAWNADAAAFYAPAELLRLDRMVATIERVRTEVDFLVVMFNSGTEDTHDPSPRSIKALRAAADAGADLVIGNQAHHAQAAEVRGGVFIAYALGNFVYDQVHTPEHTQGYLVEASLWGDRLAAIRLVPYQIEELYRPELAAGELRAKILGDVWHASKSLPATP